MLGQNSLLERDISKRGSLACRRRDSVIDRTSKVFEQTLQVIKVGLTIYFLYFRVEHMKSGSSFEFYCCRRLSNFLTFVIGPVM